MAITRREFLRKGAAAAPVAVLGPGVFARALEAAPAYAKRNLVFVELHGGNDGLNTVVPYGLAGGAYYDLYRTALGIPEASLLKLDGNFGLNPALLPLLPAWQAGRLAIVHGVGIPGASFSHEQAKRCWATGDPTGAVATGWLGRYLKAETGSAPRAFDVGAFANRMFSGAGELVPAFPSLKSLAFPFDAKYPADAAKRRAAFAAMCGSLGAEPGLSGAIAATGTELLDVIGEYGKLPKFSHSQGYPSHPLGAALKLVVRLLNAKLGLHFHHVQFDGFDTHAAQALGFSHDQKLAALAAALAAFEQDLAAAGVADRTIVVVYSEFGRAAFDNASYGTDHGTAAPVLVLGQPVAGGFHGEHPDLDPAALSPILELVATADFRAVLGTLVERWLGGSAAAVFPGFVPLDLGFVK